MKILNWFKKTFTKHEEDKKVLGIVLPEPELTKKEAMDILMDLQQQETDHEDPIGNEAVSDFERSTMTKQEVMLELMHCDHEEHSHQMLESISEELTESEALRIVNYHPFISIRIRCLKAMAEKVPVLIAAAEESYNEDLKKTGKEFREKYSLISKKMSDQELKDAITEFFVEDCSQWKDAHDMKFAYCTAICALGGCEYRHRFFDTEREALEAAWVDQMCGQHIDGSGTCSECYHEYMMNCI